jgi:putative membrane protein
MAAERTLLAWVRTGLAMMGFGFIVARFGFLVRELAPRGSETAPDSGWSLWIGSGLVVLGVAVNLLAAMEYRSVIRRINLRQPYQPSKLALGTVVAVTLAALGMAMIGYLFSL